MGELAESAVVEVVEFHCFLTGWLGGQLPREDGLIMHQMSAFHEDFRYITPDGQSSSIADMRQWLPDSHGKKPGLQIDIKNISIRYDYAGSAVLTYEEWQTGFEPNARCSTVLFVADRSAPHGVLWLHLHESWLPPV